MPGAKGRTGEDETLFLESVEFSGESHSPGI